MLDIFVVVALFVIGYVAASKFVTSRKTPDVNKSNNSKKAEEHYQNDMPYLWYKILDIPEGANHDQIIHAYRKQIGLYHPDKVSNLGDEIRMVAEEKSKQINAAYRYAIKLRKYN